MNKKTLLIAAAIALAMPAPVMANGNAERIAELESQIAELQEELESLKAAETSADDETNSDSWPITLNDMFCEVDDFSGDAYYYSQSGYKAFSYEGEDVGYVTIDRDSPFGTYIRYDKAEDEYTLVVHFSYSGDDWIFFDKAQIKTGDNIDTIDLSHLSPLRDTGSGHVYENYFVRPGADLIKAMENMADAGEATIRLSGSDGHFDYTLDESIIQATADTLSVYNQLNK